MDFVEPLVKVSGYQWVFFIIYVTHLQYFISFYRLVHPKPAQDEMSGNEGVNFHWDLIPGQLTRSIKCKAAADVEEQFTFSSRFPPRPPTGICDSSSGHQDKHGQVAPAACSPFQERRGGGGRLGGEWRWRRSEERHKDKCEQCFPRRNE